MMPTIRIDDNVFRGLQELATPFVDTPNTIIKRLLEKEGVIKQSEESTDNRTSIQQRHSSTTNTRPTSFTFKGRTHAANSWREILLKLCEELSTISSTKFDKVLELRSRKGKRLPYFSKSQIDLRDPKKIKGTDIYAETNLSAPQVIDRCYLLLKHLGHEENDFEYKTIDD